MTELHQALATRVAGWRDGGYQSDRFPAIAEILGYAFEDDEARQLRYLRAAQFRALETYWYLRLVEGTPHVADLRELNLTPADVQDVYFTGAITDPRKTDLSFAYPKGNGSEGRYTPDFVIHATGDRWMLVEVKMTGRRADPVEGAEGTKAAAIRKLAALGSGPDRLPHGVRGSDRPGRGRDGRQGLPLRSWNGILKAR